MTRFDFNMQGMFREIDDWSYKYVDIKNMKRFLIKNSVYPNDGILKAIVRRLDTDGDARLSFKEFTDAVTPQTGASKFGKVSGSVRNTLPKNSSKLIP